MAAKSGKSKRKVFFTVGCQIHGNTQAKGQSYKELKVGLPKSRGHALHSGCPMCKAGVE